MTWLLKLAGLPLAGAIRCGTQTLQKEAPKFKGYSENLAHKTNGSLLSALENNAEEQKTLHCIK